MFHVNATVLFSFFLYGPTFEFEKMS